MSVLNAIYDLKISPCSFECVHVLYAAETYRLHLGLDAMDFIVVGNDEDIFRIDGPQADRVDDLQKKWELRNGLLQIDTLLPACRRTLFFPNRDEAIAYLATQEHTFPIGYDVSTPPTENLNLYYSIVNVVLNGLRGFPAGRTGAQKESLQLIDKWISENISDEKFITLNFRELDYQTERNNDVNEWAQFAQYLADKGFTPVMVRDTFKAFEPLSDNLAAYHRCDFASINLPLRVALYERAFMNCFVGNGIAEMARYNPSVPFMQFRVRSNKSHTTFQNLAKLGAAPGYRPYLESNLHRSYFEADKFEFMRDRFEELLAVLEEGTEPALPRWESPMIWLERYAQSGAFDVVEKIVEIIESDNNPAAGRHETILELIESNAIRLRDEGNRLDASNGLRLLIRIAPNNPAYKLLLLEILLPTDAFEEIAELILQLDAQGIDIAPFREILMNCLISCGKIQEAEEHMARLS